MARFAAEEQALLHQALQVRFVRGFKSLNPCSLATFWVRGSVLYGRFDYRHLAGVHTMGTTCYASVACSRGSYWGAKCGLALSGPASFGSCEPKLLAHVCGVGVSPPVAIIWMSSVLELFIYAGVPWAFVSRLPRGGCGC